MQSFAYREKPKHQELYFPFQHHMLTLYKLHPIIMSHWHESAEFVRILDGHCIYQIDLNAFSAGPGDLILVPPQALHSITVMPDETMHAELYNFHPDFLGANSSDVCSERYLAPLASGRLSPPELLSQTPELAIRAEEIFCSIRQAFFLKDTGYELRIKSALLLLMAEIAPYCKNEPQAPTVQSENLDKIKKVLEYIEYHYPRPISIQTLAELCDFTETYFVRFFKRYAGQSCVDYIRTLRLEHAARLLIAGRHPQDVSHAIGFRNLAYFYREFKKLYRMTPGEFQEQSSYLDDNDWRYTGKY